MADDEDDFVALGTPFEQLEEDAPRKKPVPVHEQIVTDDRGRRRFHGAFTGGFSAGYFNTVDTKEGWTPKTFVSSRSQKATERVTQRPEDFMDEEDLSEFGIAPKRVVTTQKFLPTRSDDSASGKRAGVSGSAGGAGSAVLGANLLQDLIVPVKMSVGIKLLSQMGWKEGQGVGPRVRREAKKTYGCVGPPGTEPDKPGDEEDIYAVGLFFAPKDVESFEFTSKDDLHGIGYSGIDPKTALLNQRDWLGMNTHTSSIGIRGQAFGVGALEEDDEDIYAQDNLSKYDIELNTSRTKKRNDLHGWSGPQQTSGQGGFLSIFCKALKPPPARKHYPPPVVPRDFKPFHKPEQTTQPKQPLPGPPVNQGQKIKEANQTRKRLTAKERGEALGEVPLPTPKKSIFDYIAEEDKDRLKESKEKANASKERGKTHENNDLDRRFISRGPLSTSGFKPFAKDPEKQDRYEQYLSGKGDGDVPSQTDSKMTEWERECELEEFARAAALYRPLSQTMAARFTSAKDTDERQHEEDPGKKDQSTAAKMKFFGALTRERFEWHPDRVLCKRFNIPDPYPGSGVTGVVMKRREKAKTDEKVIREVKAIECKPHLSEPDLDEAKSSRQRDEAEMVQKPSALIAGFQSIVTQQKLRQPSDTSTETAKKEELKIPVQATESDANVVKRAPMDLFNEIFAESSSESESESEENDEIGESKTFELDVKDSEEKTDGNIETKNAPQESDVPISAPGGNTPPETLERQKVPSPETFGPVLPSSFGGSAASSCTSKGFYFSTREDSPKRQEKQKRRKKKKQKEKETGSDISDSEDGQSRRRREKKRSKTNKGSDFTDSDEEYKSKKKKTKTREKGVDSELSSSDEKDTRKKKKKSSKYKSSALSDSENEESFRCKKKKIRSKYSDDEDKYDKRKKNRRGKVDSDDDQSNEEYTKQRKKKRKDKEKSVKERKKYSQKSKKSDQQEYEEIQYEPEKYVEKVAQNAHDENSSKSFDCPGSSGYRKSNYHEKNKDSQEETSKKDTRDSTNSRTDNDPVKKQDISGVPNNKEIINKLKNIQMLKERKRMRAADFM